MWKKYIQRFILIVIAILGIKTSIESFVLNANRQSNDNDTVYMSKWEGWVSKLIAPIPFKRGFVGYISNQDIPGAAFNKDNDDGEYVLTQYAVAPLILIRGTKQEWNILNLDPETYKMWILANANDFRFIELAGGMYLVQKVSK